MQSHGSLQIHIPESSNRSPVSRVTQSQIGVWPDLEHLIGCEVITVRQLPNRSALVLELVRGSSPTPSARLVIPPYWVFTSPLTSFSSLDLSAGNEIPTDGEAVPELRSLEGARLTDIESDHEHLDLVFPSLRISVIPEAF